MLSIEFIQSIDWLEYDLARRMRPIADFNHSLHGGVDMLGIGQKFPQYSLTGVVSNDQARAFQNFDAGTQKGKWRIVFFWPKDFTFVCPTEIAAFGKLDKEFRARDAQLLGVSTDSEYVHLAWRSTSSGLRPTERSVT